MSGAREVAGMPAGSALGEQAGAAPKLGLLGYPLGHSLSPAMHNAALRQLGLPWSYVLVPAPPAEFERAVERCRREGFVGWNVTVPHKERMLPLLDAMSGEVRAVGACNTVRVEGDGRLVGFNTDVFGFMGGLGEAGGIGEGSGAVLLGAGGACRAVGYALAKAGHEVVVLSRRPEQAERLAASLRPHAGRTPAAGRLDRQSLAAALLHASLLVNCTPAGQWPHTEETPLPEGIEIGPGLLVYDLIYNPRPTRLLQIAAAQGCRTQDGLAMLVQQGAAALELWTGLVAPAATMRAAVEGGEPGNGNTQLVNHLANEQKGTTDE